MSFPLRKSKDKIVIHFTKNMTAYLQRSVIYLYRAAVNCLPIRQFAYPVPVADSTFRHNNHFAAATVHVYPVP